MPDQSQPSNRRVRRWALALVVALMAGGLGTAVVATRDAADAAPATQGGFTSNVSTDIASVRRGDVINISATITASSTRQALIDLEVYDTSGTKVLQKIWDAQSFTTNAARTFSTTWTVPSYAVTSTHYVKLGVFANGWSQLYHWNNSAASFTVTAANATAVIPATTAPPTAAPTTTARPATTAPPTTTARPAPAPTTAPSTARFVTLAPGSALPSDAECAARVRKVAEVRPANATANNTRGWGSPSNPPNALYKRVTGNYTGTTDEIIQWASCKWGFDEDVIRAQTAKESWFFQRTVGDNGQSYGLQQVRQPYWGWAFNNGNGDARTSSAFNLDSALAARRSCFEGHETWLGGSYGKGDLWGCVGLWYSGRWHTSEAEWYIGEVKSYLSQRIWETANFKAAK